MAIRKMRIKKRKAVKKKRSTAMVRMIDNARRTFTAVQEVMFPISNPAVGVAGYSDVCCTFTLNHPTYGFVASGEGQYPTVSSNYTELFALFDQYRVKALEVLYYPSFVDTQLTANVMNSDQPSILYCYNDPDDNALVTSEVNMLQGGMKPRQCVTGKVIRQVFKNPDKEYLNTGSNSVISSSAITTSTQQNPRAYASVKLFWPRLYHSAAGGATTYFGRVYARWLVEFKSLKTA